MATKKESQQSEVVQQEQHSYVVGLDRGKAKWLTFEYVLSMMSLVLAALLITVALQPLFGEWAGRGSAVNYSGSSWLFGLFSLTMATKSTGLVVTAVAAILLAVVALLGFRRVTNGIVDREGYTSRLSYKLVTYGGLGALILPMIALAAQLIGILISSLLFIGVRGSGEVYKSLYLAEFLPYALGLGVLAATAFFVGKIVNGVNASKIASFVLLGVSSALLLASVITVTVQSHKTSRPSEDLSTYMKEYSKYLTD